MGKSPFEQRYIAFVDVLGFANVVERMENERHVFNTVRDVLKSLDNQAQIFRKYRQSMRAKREATRRKGSAPLIPPSDLQMTAFSDCYVLSEIGAAWHVLAAVQALGSRFLAEGILIRGAVVRGRAYHKGRVLFGPGIVEAYNLERDVAKYPRILVSEQVRAEEWSYHTGSRWQERLLEHDVDGCWFVNLLVPSLSKWETLSNRNHPQDIQSHLTKVRQSLTGAWQRAQGDAGHMSKVWWLIHKFNGAAKEEGVEPIERP
jgi:hypothetical protein